MNGSTLRVSNSLIFIVSSSLICDDGFGLVVLGLTALRDSSSVYIGPSPKEREKEKRKDRGE